MRDPQRLEAFKFADSLVLLVYRITANFPQEEQFGLTQQIRRAAVSVPSNIVEGCARHSEMEYLRFLDIAFGSLKELNYQLSLAERLGYIPPPLYAEVAALGDRAARILSGLIGSLRRSNH